MSDASLDQFCLVPDEYLLPLPDEATSINFPEDHTIVINGKHITLKELRLLYHGKYKTLSGLAAHFGITIHRAKIVLESNQIAIISPDYVRKIKADRTAEKYMGRKAFLQMSDGGYLMNIRYDPSIGRVKRVPLHREVIRAAGIYLEKENRVHHIDLDKTNNDLSNLFVAKNCVDHQRLHTNLDNLCSIFIKMGIIKFDDGEYRVDFNKLREEDIAKLKHPPYKATV